MSNFRFPTNPNWRPSNAVARNGLTRQEQNKQSLKDITKSGLWGQSLAVACGPYPPPVFGETLGHPPFSGANAWGPESYVTPPRSSSNKALLNIIRENENNERRGEGVGMNGSSDGEIQPLRGGLERNQGIDMRGESKFNQDSSTRNFTGQSSMIDSGMGGMSSGFDLRATSSMNTMKNNGFGSGIGGSFGSRPSGMGFSGMGTNSYPTGGQNQFKVLSKSKQLLINQVKRRSSETTVCSSNAKGISRNNNSHNGEGSEGKGSGVDCKKARMDRGDSFLVSSLQNPQSTSRQQQYSQQETRSSMPSATPSASLPSRQQQTQATPSPLQKVPDHRSRKSAEPEDETERMRAELLQKEKELSDIKRKLLDAQIAEARGQMNTGATTAPPPANNLISTSTITSSTSSTKKVDPGLEAEIRVYKIGDYVTERMMRALFGEYGTVVAVQFPKKKNGSCHVLLSTKEEAQMCIKNVHGKKYKSRTLEVTSALVKMCLREDSEELLYCEKHNICLNFNTHDEGCTVVGVCTRRHICRWCHELDGTTLPHRSRFGCPQKTEGYVDYAVSKNSDLDLDI